MEIVPVTSKKKSEVGLDLLLSRKAELKKELSYQKKLITSESQTLFSVSYFTNSLFNSFNKGVGFVDAVIMGYKVVKSIRGLFRKFK
jgi:hypothetical protein